MLKQLAAALWPFVLQPSWLGSPGFWGCFGVCVDMGQGFHLLYAWNLFFLLLSLSALGFS